LIDRFQLLALESLSDNLQPSTFNGRKQNNTDYYQCICVARIFTAEGGRWGGEEIAHYGAFMRQMCVTAGYKIYKLSIFGILVLGYTTPLVHPLHPCHAYVSVK